MRIAIVLILLLLNLDAWGSGVCDLEKHLKGTFYHEELADKALKIFYKLSDINGKALSGEKIPEWEEIEDLNYLVRSLEALKAQYKFPTKEDEIAFYHRLFLESPIAIKKFEDLKSLTNSKVDYDNIHLGHLELIHFYRQLYRRLEEFIPEKIDLEDINIEQRREKLALEGEEMLRKQEELFKELFAQTEFINFASYQARLAEKKSELGEEALQTLQDGDFLISMRRTQKARWWVPKVGFQNQRITRSSEGTFDIRLRSKAEATLTGNELDSYSQLDWDLMPKYGFLETRDYQIGSNTKEYGDDIYLFNPKKIERRLTFTTRDSLGLGLAGDTNSSFAYRFIPWENREIIASTDWYKLFGGSNEGLNLGLEVYLEHYVEAQYFGPIRLDDVKTFIFTKSPPEGEFLQELISRNIEILDQRKEGIPVKWEPPAEVKNEVVVTEVTEFKPYKESKKK